jgi:hypothetical protein
MKKWIFLVSAFLLTSTAYSKGKLQDSDFKSLSELTTAGGTSSQLLNDTKIYITASGINSQLSSAITNGLIGGGGGGSSGVNLIVNPGFETGIVQGYSSSGGTFAAISSGSNLLIGKGSATFQATATGQYMSSAAYAVPNGLKGTNCAVGALYSGGDANLVLQAYDGTNVLASTPLTPSTVPRPAYATFVCPSSGNIQERVVSSGSSALVALDQFFLGQNTISQVSQATLYGTISITGGCSSNFGTTSTSFASLNNGVTGCAYASTGNASAPSSSIPAITFASLPPGHYLVDVTGNYFQTTSGKAATYTITDGTNYSVEQGSIYISSGGEINAGTVGTFSFNYLTAQSNVTFQIQGFTDSGGGANLGANGLTIKVYRYPTQSELAVRPETINWLVDAFEYNVNIPLPSGTFSGGPTSIQDASNAISISPNGANTLAVQQPCTGFASNGLDCSTTGSSAAEAGVVFNLPSAGSVDVCVSGNVVVAGTGISNIDGFSILETPNTSLTILQSSQIGASVQSIGTVAGNSVPFSGCGTLKFASSGQKTIKLGYTYSTSGSYSQHLLLMDQSGGRNLHWTIKPITQNVPAPILVGSVISPSAGVQNIVTAEFDGGSGAVCSGSTCTVNFQNGNAISSVTRSGTGGYVINFVSGTFTSPPLCTCNSTGGGGAAGLQFCFAPGAGFGGSNSSVGMLIGDKTGTAADGFVNIQCIGNK